MNQTLSSLFGIATQKTAGQPTLLAASGSNRHYFRIQDEGKVIHLIGVQGTVREENDAFLYMSQHFSQLGLPVPRVIAVSDDHLQYLQEDLGDTLLFDYIAEGRQTGVFSEREKEMLRRTLRLLAKVQVVGAQGMDFSRCYPLSEFNHRSILWDLNYFKYCFLKASGLEFQEDRLETSFEQLATILLGQPMDTFMYRDFQSRNVMVVSRDGEESPYLIDFQGGRKGPIYYDVASFLWQAKANYPTDLRQELIGVYQEELSRYMEINRDTFEDILHHFVLFRTLQVLGAYGFRGYFEKKPHFLQSIPYAIDNLRHTLTQVGDEYPYLKEVLLQMTELKQFKEVSVRKPLKVRVYSFSYKKGIPQDDSGNGGGFVFDCRAVNNPGKYERFNHFTGMDEPVVRFIEDDGEMKPFLEASYNLVDASVKRYMDRGFQNLMVCFGCTGGQHRSVYAAEKMAEHIHTKFGVDVQLIHREQNIDRFL